MFNTENYTIIESDEKDVNEIATVYNSNKDFLMNHIDMEKVTVWWCLHEYLDLRESGFFRYKITETLSGLLMGFMDFLVAEETYLSLIMISGEIKRRGVGKEVMRGFEKVVKTQNSNRIRIDVVDSYDETSLGFWLKNGFNIDKKVTLRWGNKEIPALKMFKEIQ
jgi:GNAT superfamily N-acetyltransferase